MINRAKRLKYRADNLTSVKVYEARHDNRHHDTFFWKIINLTAVKVYET